MTSSPISADNRIAQCFAALRAQSRKAFIVYIGAGDPDLAFTERLVVGLAEAGTDIIELGMPFSDPMADGPTNQAAAERGLASGTTLRRLFSSMQRVRAQTQVPVLLYTYLNPILAFGAERFASEAVACGIDGVLVLDLPPDEDSGTLDCLRNAGLATVCLATPNTAEERKAFLAASSRGFLYYVCRLGVTGERDSLPEDLASQVARLRGDGSVPVCIGFGISSPEQAAQAAAVADGVIVGSHLVRLVEQHGADSDGVERVCARARLLAEAVHGSN
ncbi:MAG: tryptophan synthase subunit alpha [Planctomycetota bacterium]|nr:MAG: tryptophan synthase subunit alpha [Planctomycetota bacterium]